MKTVIEYSLDGDQKMVSISREDPSVKSVLTYYAAILDRLVKLTSQGAVITKVTKES